MRTKLSILFWIIQSSTKSLARARTVPKFFDTIEQYTKGHEQYFSDQHKDSGRGSYTNSFNPTYNYDWENNMKKFNY